MSLKSTSAAISTKPDQTSESAISSTPVTQPKTHCSPKSETNKRPRLPRVNWHEAAVCALRIDLRDYDDLLEYMTEYVLGKNGLRIDLLVIKKLTDQIISKDIARLFRTFNLFEIKGLGSSITTDAYYKTIGYAGLLINQSGGRNEYSALDISLTFLSLRSPRRLISHLRRDRHLTVAKIAAGVYHISKETFPAQIIVTSELSPEDCLYLRCLTDRLAETGLADRLADDYRLHQEQEVYIRYLHQLTRANTKTKGESLMVCEGLLNLFGTSSEEIIERTRREDSEYYLPKIEELSSQNTYLKSLLQQHNIPFDSDTGTSAD